MDPAIQLPSCENRNLIHKTGVVLNGDEIQNAGVILNGFVDANTSVGSLHSLHDSHVLTGNQSSASLPRVSAIFVCEQSISAQLDHFQYLFLLRLVDGVTDMQKQVESDIFRITGEFKSQMDLLFTQSCFDD